jgi:hypothetical protein
MAVDSDPGYQRADRVLWRDTGQHVLVLTTGDRKDVAVLGGGSAALWRLLQRRLSLSEIVASLVSEQGGHHPAENDVADAVNALVARGLVRLEGTPQT